MKKRRILCFSLLGVLSAALGTGVYRSLAGSWESGTVSSARELPLIGPYVETLGPSGPIHYVYHRMYIRPTSSILVTGKSSTKQFRAFFAQRIRTFEDHDRSAWTHIIHRMGADPCGFCVGEPHRDLVGYREVWTPNEEFVIRAVFRVDDNCFTLHGLQVRDANDSRL